MLGPAEEGAEELGFAEELSALEERIKQLRRGVSGLSVREEYLVDLENMHEELRVADEEIRAQRQEVERLLACQRSAQWQRERLIAVLPAAVLITDGNGVIQLANAAAAQLLDTRVDGLLRKPLPVYVAPDERREVRRLLGRLNHGGEALRGVFTLHPHGSQPVRVEAVAQGTEDPGSENRVVTWLLLKPDGDEDPSRAKPAFASAFSELTRVPLHSTGRREVLVSVASICARAFGPGAAVSVSVGRPTSPDHIGSDSRLAQEVDGAQVVAGDGPSQTAWETREPVLSADLRYDERWPRLGARIATQRVGAAVAVPVMLGDNVIGTFNLYVEPGRVLGSAQLRIAQLMAATVAAIVHEMDQKTELETLTTQLQEALQSRAVIDQAKGMIMMLEHCDADTAFTRLVQMSSHANVKLREVAQQLVESALKD